MKFLFILLIGFFISACSQIDIKESNAFSELSSSQWSVSPDNDRQLYNKIKNLLDSGLNPNAVSQYVTLLELAINNNLTEIAVLLIQRGSDVNHISRFDNKPLIISATQRGNIEVVSSLIKAGAYINGTDIHGKNALDYISNSKVDISLIKLLIDNGANISNQNNSKKFVAMLYSQFKQAGDERYIAKLAYLDSLHFFNEVDYQAIKEDDVYQTYIRLFSFNCKLSPGDWYVPSKHCLTGSSANKITAFNKESLNIFKGSIKNKKLLKGTVLSGKDVLFSGTFEKNSYKQGALYNNGVLVFDGEFKNTSFYKGKVYKQGKVTFIGYLKNNKPHGKGQCLYEGRFEKCHFKGNKRIDLAHKKRKEYDRLKYCQSNPFSIEGISKHAKELSRACSNEYKSFEYVVNDYTPDYTTKHVRSKLYNVTQCLRNLNKSQERLTTILKQVSYKANRINCKSSEPVFHNIKLYRSDLTKANSILDTIKPMQTAANEMMEEVSNIRYSYIEQKKSNERKQILGAILTGVTQYAQEYSRLKTERQIQYAQAVKRQNAMSASSREWASTMQKRFSQGKSSDGISGKRYIDNSSSITASSLNLNKDNEIGRSKSKDKGTHNYTFECEATGQTTTIPIPNYYTSSCDDALKVFSKVYACNLIDDMDSAKSRCVNACGRSDCMQAE